MLKRMGVNKDPLRPDHFYKGEEHKDEIIEMYESGLSLNDVARKICYHKKYDSFSNRTVRHILRKYGVKIRERHKTGKRRDITYAKQGRSGRHAAGFRSAEEK